MPWGKSQEEKEQEAASQAAASMAATAARAAASQAAATARAAAERAASPVGRAAQARASDQTFFQMELEVSSLTGPPSSFGSSNNQVKHTGQPDLLGEIEAVGWHLEHVGYVFVETGATSTNRVLGTGQGLVTRGSIMGIYLFRSTATAGGVVET